MIKNRPKHFISQTQKTLPNRTTATLAECIVRNKVSIAKTIRTVTYILENYF